uniref:Cytidyltransferase-like domain-containing protein n=1 Tax=Chromera velia CCMP2878 TaxID=1169474 RepID=A0A0G4IFV2_9ALVE|mmetsp:Transcript_22798/g.44907  ORF Transcript_22798/g.44907 Transcript_22798/m.44907 type:complete len:218 (-) Transcript_22798:74-727(-)|eukprot:Cvel_14028.t1-p1 / transcript=Cvel_14028.t1 / gene=Cvel_14028 / organism=Chromera_velia_CCMP2878 / gene_product=Probable nicotinate-nucleotide adenylyltransferase, putative / transcript_product=Probable nicotinate-nucleotide adenylyltransferase, putative / location=Cvel_scaffold982:46528-49828(+) / protein_length=217 / sequence_SO=supercontig / SO=protein_coding / is_pseudo=false
MSTVKKRVVVLGGSFDPPTVAHMKAAAEPVQAGVADEVWLIPCGRRPDKDSVASPEDRLHMCRVAVTSTFTEDFPICVQDTEIAHGQFIPSFFLMERLQKENPDKEVRLLIGTDLIPTLKRWIRGEDLVASCPFLVVPREGFPGPSELPSEQLPADFVDLEATMREKQIGTSISSLSSTIVRNRLKNAQTEEERSLCCQGLVPLGVAKYISEKKLYA